MEHTELQIAASELRSLAGRILKAARQDTEQRLLANGVGISVMQYGILQILQEKDCTLSELSGRMGREPTTLLPAVDALETKAMLQRGQDPNDRRRTPLSITAQGRHVLEQVPQVGESDLLLEALGGLDDQKVELLISLLREVDWQVAQGKQTKQPDPRR